MYLEHAESAIEKAFAKRRHSNPEKFQSLTEFFRALDREDVLSLKYLYSVMPRSDLFMYAPETFLDFAHQAVKIYHERRDVRALPEEIFLQYVLLHRVNDEDIRPCRAYFYEAVKDRLTFDAETDARLVNVWCAENGTYRSTDDRTISALGFYGRGFGRCGEESVFLVNALRSVGIPARQVYVPWWSHCDDNHAWVEVFVGDRWHFMGACEPAASLDSGWFRKAASRALFVRSLYFGTLFRPKDCVACDGITSVLNQTERYARVKTTEILTEPFAHLAVSVINDSQLRTLLEITADARGRAEITLGLGTVLIEGRCGKLYGRALRNREEVIRLPLTETFPEGVWDWDFYAPEGERFFKGETRAQEKETLLLRAEAQARLKEKETVSQKEAFLAFANSLGMEREGAAFFSFLTEKDASDALLTVLKSQFLETIPLFEKTGAMEKALCGCRIGNEGLTPWRRDIRKFLGEESLKAFARDPERAVTYVRNRIEIDTQEEKRGLITTPGALLEARKGSLMSRAVLLVALLRCSGIPARLLMQECGMEYYKDGAWRAVPARELSAHLFCKGVEGCLYRETFLGRHIVPEPWDNIAPGRYMFLWSERVPSGHVFARAETFSLKEGETRQIRCEKRLLPLSKMLTDVLLPDLEVKNRLGKTVSGEELFQGTKILLSLTPGMEPAEHVLDALGEEKKRFQKYAKEFILWVAGEDSERDPRVQTFLKTYPETAIFFDPDRRAHKKLCRGLFQDPDGESLLALVDNQTCLYSVSGYSVGTVSMLYRLRERKNEKQDF